MPQLNNKKIKSFTYTFTLIWLGFQITHSNNLLINELWEYFQKSHSDGEISSGQYNHIISELREEPQCEEIRDLILISGIAADELIELLKRYCPAPREKAEKKIESKNDYGFKGYVSQIVFPKHGDSTRFRIKVEAQSPVINTAMDFNTEEKKIASRNLGILWENWRLFAGNFSPPLKLDFIVGRQFWMNQNSLSDSVGLILSSRNQLNGLSILHRNSRFSANAYSSWNKSLSHMTRLDMGAAGAALRINFPRWSATAHSHFTKFDFPGIRNEHSLVSGIRICEKFWNQFDLGIGHSWHGHGMSSETNFLKSGYAELEFRQGNTGVAGKIFQAGNKWTNPLAQYWLKTTDSTESGILLPGKGEGGIHLKATLPLYQTEIPGHLTGADFCLHLRTTVHWNRNRQDFRYFQNKTGLTFQKSRFSSKGQLTTVFFDSSRYIQLKKVFGLNAGNSSFAVHYSHKAGKYSGTYPRVLGIKTDRHTTRMLNIRAVARVRDVMYPQKRQDILIFQHWSLSGSTSFDTSLRLEFDHFKLRKEAYYQFRLQGKL